jgi:60 kDa SS-A/Ro ribonucleoprotein
MTYPDIAGMPGIPPRVGAAAMALVTANVEPLYEVTAFTHNLTPFPISPRQRLDDVVHKTSGLPFMSTDCSLPMEWAIRNKREVDVFVVYTDSETNHYGSRQPVAALRDYRQRMGIDAKLIVVGMVSNGFSIADPDDTGMLDVVGFDTATPNIMSAFAKGEV